MMLLALLIELLFLYLLSRRLIQAIYRMVFTIARSRTVSLSLVTILFFPGTVVHELAHLFVAEVLRVRTGKLTLVPDVPGEASAKSGSLEGTEIKAGGVMIAQTDPLRRTLIGLAPVYVGVAVLTALSYFFQQFNNVTIITIGILYIMFAVSNSMFASREDMKGVIPFTITVGLFAAAGYIAGFRVGLTGELLTRITLIIQTLVRNLGMVIGVNLVVLATTSIFLTLLTPHRK
ncbi:hypothetical protein HY411_00605 [Candidatus Gottesmanbacteria bacterium]|nr:hypothetical protein [Candidatus Gottesmanbacteria bacterium]